MKGIKLGAINPLGLLRTLGEKAMGPAAKSKPPASPPGTLIHIGKRLTDRLTISVFEYDAERLEEIETEEVAGLTRFHETEPVTWIRVTGLHDVEKIAAMGEAFGIHALVLEDILHTNSRAKVEEFDDYVFVVTKLLSWDAADEQLDVQQFAMVILPRAVITFMEGPSSVLDPVVHRIREGRGRLRKSREDYLAWAILDALVDHYFVVIDEVDSRLSAMDEEMQVNITAVDARVLFAMKRELFELHRLVRPIREVVTILHRADSRLITKQSRPFYRDLYDHAIHAIERLEDLRELGSSLRDFYMAAAGNRMNEIMKVLTIFATFFLPITFVAGVYGMNFEHMPELKWRWAYPTLWAVFIGIAMTMVVLFRRKKWF